MVVSMGRDIGDGRVVDGGMVFSTMIYDMMASRLEDKQDGRMRSSVVISTMISSMMTSRKEVIGDDELTCGVLASRKENRGDYRLVVGKVVFGEMTSNIMTSKEDNRGVGRIINDEVVSILTLREKV